MLFIRLAHSNCCSCSNKRKKEKRKSIYTLSLDHEDGIGLIIYQQFGFYSMHQMSQDDSLRFTLFQSQRATYMCFRDISYRDQLLGGSTWIGSFVLHNSSCNKNISYMDRHQLVHQLTRRFCIHLEDDPWNRARSFICPLVFPTNASSCSQDHVIHLANLITGNDDTILPFMNTTRLHMLL